MTLLSIDRMTPTLRPSGRVAMHQRWADLLFVHWPVPVQMLRPLIPSSLEIDTFDGVAYVGLVPFTMTGVRPVWSPSVPGLSNFHEVNVRTYVHRDGRDPGVWFFSLDAAQSIAVRIARGVWHLPYHFARMSLERDGQGVVRYRSERLWPGPLPASCDLAYRPEGSPRSAEPGTLEHFLAERYILYAQGRTGMCLGRVHHTAYPLQQARILDLNETLVAASGIDRTQDAPLVHYASEVKVEVFPLRRIEEFHAETERARRGRGEDKDQEGG